jgi:hypothetical protein
MRKHLIFIALLSQHLNAQGYPDAYPASFSPGNASVAYTKNWTCFQNPSILAKENYTSIFLDYENRFQLKELSTGSLGLAIPTKQINLGLGYSYFGYSQYHEMQAGISLAREFSKRFFLGLGFNYYNVLISPDEAYKGTLITQIGLLSNLSENFVIGFHAYNPTQASIRLKLTSKRIPSVFELGCSYNFSEKLLWVVQLDKATDAPIEWKTGFEYRLVKTISLQVGGYGNPFVPKVGMAFYLKKLKLDMDFERHTLLGINSHCRLSYCFR